MPEHKHYVEPYAGGLAVLLAKDPVGVSEVVNDVNGELMNFWRVLQRPSTFDRFMRRLVATPFSEVEWQAAGALQSCDNVTRAAAFFVRCRQSRAGSFGSFAPLSRNRLRGEMNEQASAWINAVDGLTAVATRLRRVVVLNRPALDVIRTQDGPNTLFYLDPPYLAETRVTKEVYEHEMTRGQHEELLEVILKCKGKVMLSGYPSDLYAEMLTGWPTADKVIDNKASSAKKKPEKTERLWVSFDVEVGQP